MPELNRVAREVDRFYDLRHTAATLLLLADVSPKIVQERLGRGTVQISLDTYSHVLPTLQKVATEKLDRLFVEHGGTRSKRPVEAGVIIPDGIRI